MNEQRLRAGVLLEREATLGLEEFAVACGAPAVWIVEIVQAGVLAAREGEPQAWRFDSPDLARAHRLRRLQQDFEADLELAALVLDLTDEIARLRTRLKRAGLDPG